MIRLECKDGAHYKFWDGRIGTAGQSHAKKLKTHAAAQAELEKSDARKARARLREKRRSNIFEREEGGVQTRITERRSREERAGKKVDSSSAPLLLLAERLAPGHAKTRA